MGSLRWDHGPGKVPWEGAGPNADMPIPLPHLTLGRSARTSPPPLIRTRSRAARCAARNGQSLSFDPDQTLFPQPTLCMCKGCQQHLLDVTGYGCVSCAAKDHLAGAAHCPRQQARRAQLLHKRDLALAAAALPTKSAHHAIPTATLSTQQERPQGKKLSALAEGDETEDEDSDDDADVSENCECGCIPPNALPYCAAGADPRVGCGSTDLEELARGLKL
jgi:hypothetical protein